MACVGWRFGGYFDHVDVCGDQDGGGLLKIEVGVRVADNGEPSEYATVYSEHVAPVGDIVEPATAFSPARRAASTGQVIEALIKAFMRVHLAVGSTGANGKDLASYLRILADHVESDSENEVGDDKR